MIDKIIELFDKGYCNECNELNCLGGEPSSKNVAKAIKQLQQENQQLKDELNTCMIERNKLVDVIDEAIDTINNMINIGYTKDLTGYFPTGLDSEFGIRALIIKEILQKYKGDKVNWDNRLLKQALNKIRKVITECKMLMPHEFDWEEQTDYILQIIDKYTKEDD